MKKLQWKSFLPELVICAVFVIASAIYFMPALQGKIVYGGDNINVTAAIHEGTQFLEQTGESTFWTNSMFSGMPNIQIGGYQMIARKVLAPCYLFFQWGARNVYFIMLFYLLAFYLLLRTFKVDKWLGLAGAFATALSSYFFIIIAATHNAKCIALTWMTVVMVGFLLVFRKQYGWGAVLTMLFVPMGFFIHPQMGYYICMLMGLFWCAEIYVHIKEKRFRDFGVGTLIFACAFAVGLGIGGASFFATQEYASQTMRGGHSDLQKEKDERNKVQNGLDLDYATAWSYGINETMTLLIPNYMGAASGYNVGTNSVLYNELVQAGIPKQSAKQFCEHAPTYWGEQPCTAGPVYVGAIVCFLFLLGLMIVKGPYKWALLVATVFAILLSWGHNFMPMTEVFFHYFPMYNKFRAVSSILVVAEITMPLLGFMAVQTLVRHKGNLLEQKRDRVAIYVSAGITAGICLLFALFGGRMFDFTCSGDRQFIFQLPDFAYQALLSQRAAMLQADAWRSFAFIAAAVVLLVVYQRKGFKTIWLGVLLAVLVVLDMWPVAKRFCNDDNFVTVKQRDKTFAMYPYERELLNDKSHFRVLNLTTNTFNESRTSYYLKSVGGYSAAKLRRYQDLIDEHLSKMNMNVINMLNTKYVIVQGRDGQPVAQLNPDAMGNAWFVDSLLVVNTANEESDALHCLDLHKVAVTDSRFVDVVTALSTPADSAARIELESYAPNRLVYHSFSSEAKTAVFSEVYYPFGWKVTIDGQPWEHFRVNYTLRALNVPAGEHEIVFSYEPDSVRKGNMVSVICIIVLFLTIAGVIGWTVYKRRRHEEAD